MQKKKSGVKKCLEIRPLGGGGGEVRRLMEKTILDFYFDYLNISLSQVKDNVISNINHGFIKMYEEQLFKRSEGSGMFDILSCRFWDVCICKSFSGQFYCLQLQDSQTSWDICNQCIFLNFFNYVKE